MQTNQGRKSGLGFPRRVTMIHTQCVTMPDIEQDVFDWFTSVDVDQTDLHVPGIAKLEHFDIRHWNMWDRDRHGERLHWQTIFEFREVRSNRVFSVLKALKFSCETIHVEPRRLLTWK